MIRTIIIEWTPYVKFLLYLKINYLVNYTYYTMYYTYVLVSNFLVLYQTMLFISFRNEIFRYTSILVYRFGIALNNMVSSVFQLIQIVKISSHPIISFPFGYLESSFVHSISRLFSQFPPAWLEYFKGALVPLIAYNFLDSHLATIVGHLHFTEAGTFVINCSTRTEDLICT